jgi:histidinol-phosphatase
VAEPDLRLALELADIADGLSLPAFGRTTGERKADGSAVSRVDHEIEHRLRARLADAAPKDSVVGEELGAGAPAPRRWILDPLDGTEYFLRRIPTWATMLALDDERGHRVAVVSAPALRMRWWAARGEGAFFNGRRIRVSGTDAVAEAFVAHSNLFWPKLGKEIVGRISNVLQEARWSAGFEAFTGAMLVAAGAVDAAVTPVGKLWDHAPVSLIVEEAGGRISDFAGAAAPAEGPLLASNAQLHDQLVALLGD